MPAPAARPGSHDRAAPTLGLRIGYLVGVAMLAMSITWLWLGMRAVMEIGGTCASGGPYEVSTACPAGASILLVLAFPLGFLAVGVIVWKGSQLDGPWPGVAALAWPALFLGLGWNFLEYGVRPPWGDGIELGWLIPGVIFMLMGGIPLWLLIVTRGDAPIVPGVAGTRARTDVRELRDLRDAMARAARAARTNAGSDAATMTVFQATHRRPVTAPAPAHAVHPEPTPATPLAPAGDASASLVVDDAGEALVAQLERLATLHREGSLSILEFQAAKTALLAGRETPGR